MMLSGLDTYYNVAITLVAFGFARGRALEIALCAERAARTARQKPRDIIGSSNLEI